VNDTAKARKAAIAQSRGTNRQCPTCKDWILCQRGRMKLDKHIETKHPEAWARVLAVRAEFTGDCEVPLA
jgi:hypothetical protein